MLLEMGIIRAGLVIFKTDNKAACDMITKTFGSKRRKFIDLRHHYLQKMAQDHFIYVVHVAVAQKKADMFTKNLVKVQFDKHFNVVGISNALSELTDEGTDYARLTEQNRSKVPIIFLMTAYTLRQPKVVSYLRPPAYGTVGYY